MSISAMILRREITPFWMFFAGAVERIAAITIHMALSVLVWFAAKNSKRFWLFPLAERTVASSIVQGTPWRQRR